MSHATKIKFNSVAVIVVGLIYLIVEDSHTDFSFPPWINKKQQSSIGIFTEVVSVLFFSSTNLIIILLTESGEVRIQSLSILPEI